MKKIFILATLLSFAPATHSAESKVLGIYVFDILLYRPAGLVATVAGSALFVGIFPFTAFASIPHPHNAFDKVADALVVTPANYTFERPLGVVDPDIDGVYRK